MDERRQKFELYLDEKIAACKQRTKLLTEDNRVDEGNFEKVRANVYEIFRTILSVAERTCGKDDLAKRRFFLQKAEQIPTGWKTSYEDAKQHGDIKKMHIEDIKLATVQEIKDMCMQIWEETT